MSLKRKWPPTRICGGSHKTPSLFPLPSTQGCSKWRITTRKGVATKILYVPRNLCHKERTRIRKERVESILPFPVDVCNLIAYLLMKPLSDLQTVLVGPCSLPFWAWSPTWLNQIYRVESLVDALMMPIPLGNSAVRGQLVKLFEPSSTEKRIYIQVHFRSWHFRCCFNCQITLRL